MSMGPEEYEQQVANHFEGLGYKVERTPLHNDYGVDVLAQSKREKVAIQAKMYGKTKRKVNREMIMQLHGVKDYFDCDRGILVTDGEILSDAQEVADKLGIETMHLTFDNKPTRKRKTNGLTFDNIWENHVKKLEGNELVRDNGDKNKILEVNGAGIRRITSKGNDKTIDIEIFRKSINRLLENGEITRDEINQEYAKRASSGVVLILANLPMFQISKKRPTTLALVDDWENK